ncbi:MAG: YihY/virulence factor BrkB family protein [Helicobacteraceae bacterium]|jgi:membrane protein|nr:YihY/virulence factor BrkB family protein [Helicobacteraceae bacterium]
MQLSQNIKRNHYFRHTRFFVSKLFDDELSYYASSLSFYTISTIIPIFFIIFALLPQLECFDEYYATLKTFLIAHLLPVQTGLITDYIDSFIVNATQLGIFSLSFTIVVSMLFFINFSYVVNSIFKTKDRGILKTAFTYLLLTIFVPLGLIISFYLTSNINQFINIYIFDSTFEVSIFTPFIIEWTLFFLIYTFAPNIYVHYKASAISGLIAVIIWSATKALFVDYVFLAKATSTIYGPFAITIFILTWIYISWIIFVYGLRLCYLINRSYGYSKSHQKK